MTFAIVTLDSYNGGIDSISIYKQYYQRAVENYEQNQLHKLIDLAFPFQGK